MIIFVLADAVKITLNIMLHLPPLPTMRDLSKGIQDKLTHSTKNQLGKEGQIFHTTDQF